MIPKSYYTESDVLRWAIGKYGATKQENLAIEECSELIQAISHKHRGRKHNIAEEIADVEIMLQQMQLLFRCQSSVEIDVVLNI